jgi:hypothetical protein
MYILNCFIHEVPIRVDRWLLFRPKNPNLGMFWRALEWKMLLYILVISNILVPSGIFNLHFVILLSFGILIPALVFCAKKNLATLVTN